MNQQPLEGIPDDDHLNSSDEELSTNEQRDLNRLEESEHSECVPSTSAPASLTKDAATTFQNRASRMTIHEKTSLAGDVVLCLSCGQYVVARWPGSITCAPGIVLSAHPHRLTHGDVTLQSQGFQGKKKTP
ncbi:hypothetical protein ROHU_020660 [Labeo rohita]|uniref:Uncharacterized protein n=1 Tax=Labeo rohita TaxID=84645 RepID=A0A498N0B9_LABRO|nr:hypothetical protein ROHU_020660 [Labeo rohita]